MANHDLTFPDISCVKTETDISLEELLVKYKHFIAEIDITVPESLYFIPLATKTTGKNGCWYLYGTFKNQTYNDIDIKEALKAGCKFGKVHWAICFKNSIPNILADFSNTIQNKRSEVKETNEVLGNLYKLIGNSIYGKTVCWEIEEGMWFTTPEEIKEHYLDKNLIDFDELPNGQFLVRYRLDKDIANCREDPRWREVLKQQMFPTYIGSYILAYSRQIMNNFIHAINGFKT